MTSLFGNARGLLDGLVEFAFPPLCAGCGEYCTLERGICDDCAARFDRYENPICLTCEVPIFSGTSCPQCGDESFAVFPFGNYVDPLKEAVIQFKFRGVTKIAGYFASQLVTVFQERIQLLSPSCLVPIPLHPSREHERGYNQAAVFAAELGDRMGLEVRPDILIRIKKAKPQARLHDAERAQNIKGVFEAVAESESHEIVILVDDVVTGGHTVREARSVLMQAGYRVPAVLAIAHGR